MREGDGKTPGTRADVRDAQLGVGRTGRHVDLYSARAQALKRDFDDVLGFRARNQNRGRDFEIQTPEFLLAVRYWVGSPEARPRDQSKIFPDHSGIDGGFRVGVKPGAIASEHMHQQEFCSERM